MAVSKSCRPTAWAGIVTKVALQRVHYDGNNNNNNNNTVHRLFSAAETTTTESTDRQIVNEKVVPAASDYSEEEATVLSNLQSPFLQTMRDRGFLFQCTNLAELDALLASSNNNASNSISAYLGFDATADSLHVGSLLQIMILRHYQRCGHRPIVLIGGGTSKVGDPTGKDASRILLTDEIIKKNIEGISKVFRKFLTFAPPSSPSNDDDAHVNDNHHHEEPATDAIMVNNDTWLSSLQYLQFLRDYGTHFTINRMLSFESVKQRLQREAPLSFLEFNYMILQAYDFLELSRRYGARLQLGGSDQWGNMISGVELGRRVDSARLYALTAPLIATSDGKKMGKTAGGAVWLNSDRLSEYDYWQFWRNTSDEDVVRFLKLFTELPLEEIDAMEQMWKGADVNKAKIVLADEATALLHGRECLKGIHDTIDNMFGSGGNEVASTEGLTRTHVSEKDLAGGGGGGGVKVVDLFVQLGLASSKKEARRLIQGGGAKLNEEKITDENATLDLTSFDSKNEVTLRAGKKRAGVVELMKS